MTEDRLMLGCAIAVLLDITIVGLIASRGCNYALNNNYIVTATHQTESYATGLSGHVEYTKYSDGAQDVKIYPSLGHGLFDSTLYQDLDGDNKIDRIRKNGSSWTKHSLTKLLSRRGDYKDNKEEFDEADSILSDLIEKYSSQKE